MSPLRVWIRLGASLGLEPLSIVNEAAMTSSAGPRPGAIHSLGRGCVSSFGRLLAILGVVASGWLPSAMAASLAPIVRQGVPTTTPELPSSGEWLAILKRDRRVGFHARGGGRALEVIGDSAIDERERAVALIAIGAAGLVSERQRLESWAAEGRSLERRAAILGLGELAATGAGRIGEASDLLQVLVGDADLEIAECAMLALLRTQVPRWRDLVSDHGNHSGDPLARPANSLLVFCFDPEGSTPSRASDLLLDLRWDAAREFGTVDGHAWESQLLAELESNEEFLDALVYRAASELSRAGIKDHMLSLLINGQGTVRLRAVVRAMAPELDKLIEAELWMPATEEEWVTLTREALDSRLSAFLPTLLARSLQFTSVRGRAAGALALKDERYVETLVVTSGADDPAMRAGAAVGMTLSTRKELLPRLTEMSDDSDLLVRAHALVARMTMEDTRARDDISDHLRGKAPLEDDVQDAEFRAALLTALEESYMAPYVSEFLNEHLDALDRRELGGAIACLFLRGRMTETALLREAWEYVDPHSLRARRIVQALGRFPSEDDIAWLAERFPCDDDPELNQEFAQSLVRAGHPEVFPMLEAAIWDKNWDRSVLASAVVIEISGLRRLLNWIESPPPHATSEDLRRLGYAIGQWAGQEGLDQLIQRLGPRAGAEKPVLQGAMLGLLVARTH
ncbi:MAG: hypothetical protein ACI841_001658 [Planctomycetota bacterium]|jgi:hypothetical protein